MWRVEGDKCQEKTKKIRCWGYVGGTADVTWVVMGMAEPKVADLWAEGPWAPSMDRAGESNRGPSPLHTFPVWACA